MSLLSFPLPALLLGIYAYAVSKEKLRVKLFVIIFIMKNAKAWKGQMQEGVASQERGAVAEG